MATVGLIENGTKFGLTRDNLMYYRFPNWKKRVKIVFNSVQRTAGNLYKFECLKYWLGEEGFPLIGKWEAIGDFQL